MPCYHPLRAFLAPAGGAKRKPSFKYRQGWAESALPCGQCIGCRLDHARDWALRIAHESKLHRDSYFLTLTYRPEAIPPRGVLVKRHVQDFFKRFRKQRFGSEQGTLRYYACGEYGDDTHRPHYHAILFGVPLTDLKPYKKTRGGQLWTSVELERLWGHGFVTIGLCTWDTASYVARYVTKKITGKAKADHYRRVDQATGEVYELPHEFAIMSRRPGIGRGWMDRFQSDAYPCDRMVQGGVERGPPPRYYDKLLDKIDPDLLALVKAARVERAQAPKVAAHSTKQRLLDREGVAKAKLNLKGRTTI